MSHPFPNHLIVLFVLVPMFTGIITLLLHRARNVQRVLGVVSLLVLTALGGWALVTVIDGSHATYAMDAIGTVAPHHILTSQMGNWPAPFGISIVVDPLSAMMLLITPVVCLGVLIYCMGHLRDLEGGYFHPLFHMLLFGVNWSFITGDIFNLFVAFEIMLMASYALFCIGTSRAQMKQAYKYVLLNLTGSTLLVAACGFLYGQLGTLNMADITRIALAGDLPTNTIPVVGLLLLIFGGKAATFPLWFWLPDTYHTMPSAIVGLFGGLLTKVGAYVMIRVFVMMFGSTLWVDGTTGEASFPVADAILPLMLVTAGVTMFVGVLGAVSRHTVRSILAIHIISQVGYMVMGVALGMAMGLSTDYRELAVAGAIFFIIHNMVVKCCLFLCGGLMLEHAGSDDLEKIGGLLRRAPWLGLLFMIVALSLAGLPPLSGFFGKFALIKAGWAAGGELGSAYYWLTGFAIATSLFTLLSMLKIWSYGFWEPAAGRHADHPHARPRVAAGMVGVTLLTIVALSMGLGAQFYMNAAQQAAKSIVDPRPYIAAVLGDNPRYVPPHHDAPASLDDTLASHDSRASLTLKEEAP